MLVNVKSEIKGCVKITHSKLNATLDWMVFNDKTKTKLAKLT